MRITMLEDFKDLINEFSHWLDTVSLEEILKLKEEIKPDTLLNHYSIMWGITQDELRFVCDMILKSEFV